MAVSAITVALAACSHGEKREALDPLKVDARRVALTACAAWAHVSIRDEQALDLDAGPVSVAVQQSARAAAYDSRYAPLARHLDGLVVSSGRSGWDTDRADAISADCRAL